MGLTDIVMLAGGFMLALLLSLYGTPIAMTAAVRYGLIDRPDGNLKTHREPTPYLGGLALFLSLLLTVAVVFPMDAEMLGLLLSASIIVLLGLMDDFGALTPAVKFAGQIIAVFVLVRAGIRIEILVLPE